MKVILNRDLSPLGEEGDVKDVAKGYARNYLFPRDIALPYTEKTVKLFEARREQIEARKAEKRQDAAGLKEKLEALELVITMPAGANGRLYGAVTSQLVADELGKLGFATERRRIDIPGNNLKSVGRYRAAVKLYENSAAEITVVIQAQEVKAAPSSPAPARRGRRRDEAENTMPPAAEGQSAEGRVAEAPPADETPPVAEEQAAGGRDAEERVVETSSADEAPPVAEEQAAAGERSEAGPEEVPAV